jgi:hypothetical protein
LHALHAQVGDRKRHIDQLRDSGAISGEVVTGDTGWHTRIGLGNDGLRAAR